MKELLKLYMAFFRIGLFTIGGGYAMLPMIQREVVDKNKWATGEEVLDYYAIGQCTPGLIAVNTATFIGYKNAKTPGAVAATLGVISPSIIIILIIAAFFSRFQEIEAVKHAFKAVRAAVVVLVGANIAGLIKKTIVDIPTFVIAAVILVLSLLTGISPVFYVITAGAAGVFLYFIKNNKKERTGEMPSDDREADR